MPSFPSLVLLAVSLCLTGCARIELRTTANDGLPAAMVGSWSGGFTSLAGGQGGNVALRLQLFGDRPVVRIDSSHPCLVNGAYEFTLLGQRLELRRNDVVVFAADVDPSARHLTGTYGCDEDQGIWSADWQHDLPPIGDMSGIWQGSFVPGVAVPPIDFAMEVEQRWVSGFLRITGEIVVVGLGTGFPITGGNVEWNGNHFDLQLSGTQQGTTVLVQGTGSLDDGGHSTGLMLVEDVNGPFVLGSWTASRLP